MSISDPPLKEDENWRSKSFGEKVMTIFISAIIFAAISFVAYCIAATTSGK